MLNEINLEVPMATDAHDPDGDMRRLALSLSNSIFVPCMNETEQDDVAAAVAPSAANPLHVYRADLDEHRYTLDGSTWKTIAPKPTSLVQAGRVTIATVENTTRSATVTFPTPYTAAPRVVAIAYSPNPAGLSVTVSAATATTATLSAYRHATGGANSTIDWIAFGTI